MYPKVSRCFLIVLSIALVATGTSGCGGEDELQTFLSEGKPVVETMDPPGGLIGTIVTVHGEQFGESQGDGRVILYSGENGKAVDATIESWSDSTIEFRIPSSHVMDAKVLLEVQNNVGLLCPYPLYITIYSGANTGGEQN